LRKFQELAPLCGMQSSSALKHGCLQSCLRCPGANRTVFLHCVQTVDCRPKALCKTEMRSADQRHVQTAYSQSTGSRCLANDLDVSHRASHASSYKSPLLVSRAVAVSRTMGVPPRTTWPPMTSSHAVASPANLSICTVHRVIDEQTSLFTKTWDPRRPRTTEISIPRVKS